MVFEKPVIDTRELMRALDPVHGRGKHEYERLSRDELISLGVRAPERWSGPSGPGLKLYCSLNRDAISAVRRGHTDVARKIRNHAQRIERETIAPWVDVASEEWPTSEARWLEIDESHRPRRDWMDRVLFSSASLDETSVAEPVLRAAREVAEVRARFGHDEAASVRLTVGRVWKIDDVFSEVRTEAPHQDESFAFSADEILEAGLRLGDPVVIRHEELAPGVFLTTLERGLERATKIDRVSGQPVPRHLDALLDAGHLPTHKRRTRPLRRVA